MLSLTVFMVGYLQSLSSEEYSFLLLRLLKIVKMKKILIVNSHISWGGLGQYSINIARSISKRGDFYVYGLITHSDAGQFDVFKDQTKSTVSLSGNNTLLKYLLSIVYIWRLRPDVILINYNATIHFLLPLLPHTKIVSVLHSDDPDYYRVATINHSYVNAWIAPSPKTKAGLLAYLNKDLESRIHVIPHGVSESSAPVRRINEGTFRIVFIGALYKHKGVDLIPEILLRFLEKHSDSKLTIVGGGPMHEFLAEKIISFGLEEKIKFTGVVDSLTVRNILKESDVLLFPTRLEGFGLVVIEAMMEGVVPVVTHLEGITNAIVESGKNGLLVEKDNVRDFVECLSLLYKDRELMELMSSAAVDTAVEKFSADYISSKYISMFSRL